MSPTSFLSFLFMMETEAMINSPQWQHPPTPTTQKTGMDDVLRPRRRDVPLAAAQPKPDRGKPGSVQTFPAPTRPTRRRVARARGLPIAWQPSDDDRHHRPPNLISRPPTASSLPDCSRSSTTLPGASGRFRPTAHLIYSLEAAKLYSIRVLGVALEWGKCPSRTSSQTLQSLPSFFQLRQYDVPGLARFPKPTSREVQVIPDSKHRPAVILISLLHTTPYSVPPDIVGHAMKKVQIVSPTKRHGHGAARHSCIIGSFSPALPGVATVAVTRLRQDIAKFSHSSDCVHPNAQR
ncbi:uncharacterized protein CIMG_12027 [Coccidioides immitis RS]|uniref:Uncharacterized protein n=1 Tax=Coccidioides immitis (strain RS) TaxID=246410 RepID=A0A0D8JX79_COCIM|nr:uncharacterized protein CIMG_12027 [Coccidioides immitis RS]KJF60883.1 hypothetical protein CIMG_12027 [Coccidioides immitis RS]